MSAIKITSKRQATLPKALCDDLHLHPGDTIILETRKINGEKVWLLKAQTEVTPAWFGSLRKYAEGKPSDMDSVRASIARKRKGRDD